MHTIFHLLANSLVAALLGFFFDFRLGILIFFVLLGVLIDVDHILYFIVKYRAWGIKKWLSISAMLRKKMQAKFYVFHSPEFNALVAAGSLYKSIFLLVLLSNIIHISLDIADHYRYHKNFSGLKKWSVFYSLNPAD
ncbi:hypothetical protein HY638_05705 [Candidatus Woesearchaeota archaeon]|nr:hypothetical protein [Candidatus Woesearchaeota archaeon]